MKVEDHFITRNPTLIGMSIFLYVFVLLEGYIFFYQIRNGTTLAENPIFAIISVFFLTELSTYFLVNHRTKKIV